MSWDLTNDGVIHITVNNLNVTNDGTGSYHLSKSMPPAIDNAKWRVKNLGPYTVWAVGVNLVSGALDPYSFPSTIDGTNTGLENLRDSLNGCYPINVGETLDVPGTPTSGNGSACLFILDVEGVASSAFLSGAGSVLVGWRLEDYS